MNLYCTLQEYLIRFLVGLQKSDPAFLLQIAQHSEAKDRAGLMADLEKFEAHGYLRSHDDPERNICVDILLEQVELEGTTVNISHLLGTRLYDYGGPISFKEYMDRRGGGSQNRLRTDTLSHPAVLKPGDVLATGDRVLSEPREGGNGSVLLHLTGGTHGHWIEVAARIPIALLTKDHEVPPGYIDEVPASFLPD